MVIPRTCTILLNSCWRSTKQLMKSQCFSIASSSQSRLFKPPAGIERTICGRRLLHCSAVRLSEPERNTMEDEFERLVNQTRRPPLRKRRAVTATLQRNHRHPSVKSIALSEAFDLESIIADPSLNNMYNIAYIDEEFEEALHLVKKLEYTIDPSELCEAFVFGDGVAVFWNVDSTQRAHMLRELERFSKCQYDSKVAMDELDSMPFRIVDDSDTCFVKHDCFHLSSRRHGRGGHRQFESVLERFAISQAFAASVKVGVWESLLNTLSEPLSDTTKSLTNGVIPWNRKQALMRSGEFAALRHSINLDCSLLNSDFYWERTDIEKFYMMGARHFTLSRRLNVLNSRLDYCEELVKMVDNMLALRHASTLEWMIIVLIIIEVIFDVFHFANSAPQKVVIVHDGAEEAALLASAHT